MDNCGIFDSHVHLDDEQFDNDREELISALPSLGVTKVVNVGADMSSSAASVALADKYDFIYAAVGVHPHDCANVTYSDIDVLNAYVKNGKKTVAIGEIGLDYHYNDTLRDVQKTVFRMQMELAKNTDMPVILHIRDAFEDALGIMKYFGKMPANGVVHCFGGSLEFAHEVLALGYKIGIGGVVTFSNAKKLVSVTEAVSLDDILLETDCPYMAPTPYRGKRNDPSYAVLSAQKIAQIKHISVDDVIKVTHYNANRLFRITE